MDMRILVTGDRSWSCHRLAAEVIRRLVDRHGPGITIVHGGATGVDESFSAACNVLGIESESHPADWDGLGKRAGPIRNRRMIDATAGLCIAFHRSLANSKGTKDCARRAIEAGIPTYLINSDAAVPERLRAGDPRLEGFTPGGMSPAPPVRRSGGAGGSRRPPVPPSHP